MNPGRFEQQERRERPNGQLKKVAYVMSRFPKISETFILYEMLELERLGIQIEVFPLLRHREKVFHPEAQRFVSKAHYPAAFSFETLLAQFYWLTKGPLVYLLIWWNAIRGNLTSLKFLLRALVVVPRAALFARKMLRLKIEHVHAHWATHPTLAAFVVKQLTGIPYSFTAHAHDIFVERTMLREKIENARFVVTISDFNRRFLMGLYGPNVNQKIVVIHCGVDLELFHPEFDKDSTGLFTIVNIGTLEPKKGHRYLIEACAHLKRMGMEFRCLIIGDGPLREKLETQIAQLGLQNHVALLGQQPRQNVKEVLLTADLMVLPSIVTQSGRKEGIPVALMEAMAMELPVIATAISGVPELVEPERTGLLVPERQAKAIAEAVVRLQSSQEYRQNLARAGREKILHEFNLHKNSAALGRLFLDAEEIETTLQPQMEGTMP